MRAITIIAWYFSVAVGNLLVIVITHINIFENQVGNVLVFVKIIKVNIYV